MSNVFRRLRTNTGNEYWDIAMQLETELTRFLTNPKNVPKKYLYIYVVPTMGTLHKMQDAMSAAHTIFPTTPELVEQKKAAYLQAIIHCEQVIQSLQRMVQTLPIDVDKLDKIGELLVRESAILRQMRKNTKLQQTDKRE